MSHDLYHGVDQEVTRDYLRCVQHVTEGFAWRHLQRQLHDTRKAQSLRQSLSNSAEQSWDKDTYGGLDPFDVLMEVANDGRCVFPSLLGEIGGRCVSNKCLNPKTIHVHGAGAVVTWLIRCVAFWEMRNCAASMASITANTLFCGEKKPQNKLKFKWMIQCGWRQRAFTHRQVWCCSLQESHTLVQRALKKED